MAKKRQARTATRKVRDKWRAKQWYVVRAPKMFNGQAIAETLADEQEKLMGRVATATLQDLSGDFSKSHVKVHFRIAGVRGTEAYTQFKGHELTSDYVRRLTRRKHSKVDGVFDVVTQDGYTVRVKPMVVTDRRAKASQCARIREISERILFSAAEGSTMAEFIRGVVSGDISTAIYRDARKIYPIKRVEIRRSEVVLEPEELEPETDVFPEKTLEEEAEERKAQEEAEAAEAEAAEAEAAEAEEALEVEVDEEAAEAAAQELETPEEAPEAPEAEDVEDVGEAADEEAEEAEPAPEELIEEASAEDEEEAAAGEIAEELSEGVGIESEDIADEASEEEAAGGEDEEEEQTAE